MTDELEFLKKRVLELARKADRGGYYTFTPFLGLPEQAALMQVMPKLNPNAVSRFGGAEGAERIMVRFGDPEELGYDGEFPILLLRAEPLSQKFSDKLTHRDFLGSILALGLERDVIGDIVIRENVGYVFVDRDVAEFICSTLSRVKHTDVRVSVENELPAGELYRTEERKIQIASERLDAVLARVLCLSREDAQALFRKKLVFVEGRQCESVSYAPKVGERISIRGFGKLIYRGYDSLTKKGKLNVTVEVYL